MTVVELRRILANLPDDARVVTAGPLCGDAACKAVCP